MNNNQKSLISRTDGLLFWLYICVVAVGIVSVYSVEHRSTDPSFFMMNKSHMRQIIWLGVSLFTGLIILNTDSKFFSNLAFYAYLAILVLLVITIFFGAASKGSHSWLGVGPIKFQPGEIGKVFTALALAKYLSLQDKHFKVEQDRLIKWGIILVPALLIILQNETGLALVYFSFILVLYREGMSPGILIALFGIGFLAIGSLLLGHISLILIILTASVLLGLLFRFTLKRDATARLIFIGSIVFSLIFSQLIIPFVFKNVLKNYQIERIYTMLGQEVPIEYQKNTGTNDGKKRDTGYNVRQSMIAIGSGGLWGKGYLNGTSTKNSFVPEQNTDFIFCSIGEQFGFVGSTVVVLLYLALLFRIITIAERQRSDFSRIYGYCVAAVLFFHFTINILMTIGLAPVIGITLPFISYGGTSLLSFSILIFILLQLDTDRDYIIH